VKDYQLTICISNASAARLVKVADENSPLLCAGACQALGEIGRNAPLPLPPGSQETQGEVTKLSVVNNLLAIIKSGKENTKVWTLHIC